jgi:hypothetical protein
VALAFRGSTTHLVLWFGVAIGIYHLIYRALRGIQSPVAAPMVLASQTASAD